ncbi:DUF2303 family protein [Pseudomonas syringae pv. tomato]|nr:DUF2303 family protein [Pseudomonas syringae group genomosp. 3]TES78168.1 DUF2303 family protein [Pseudomonas syringae pv. tomato]
MKLMPDDLPDDPVLLKQMLLEAQDAKEAYATHIVDLKEQIKLLRDRIFGRKSEQTVEPNTPQLALFNEPKSTPNLKALTPDGEDIDLRRAAGAIRSITIEQARKSEHVVGDMSASRSAMDQIEAKSAEGLPAELLFSVIPYEGLQAQTIQLRVAVLTGGDQPVLRLRWIGEAQLREDLAQEFKQVVAQEVGLATNLTIGSFTLTLS